MQDAVAGFVHEHRDGDGFQSAVVLVGLELVEQEAALPGLFVAACVERGLVEVLAVLAEELDSPRDRAAITMERARDLPLRVLRDQQREDQPVERGLAQLVVDAKGLRREGVAAALALEALHLSAVAGAREAAATLVLAAPAGAAIRSLTGAEARLELHGSVLLGEAGMARPGDDAWAPAGLRGGDGFSAQQGQPESRRSIFRPRRSASGRASARSRP